MTRFKIDKMAFNLTKKGTEYSPYLHQKSIEYKDSFQIALLGGADSAPFLKIYFKFFPNCRKLVKIRFHKDAGIKFTNVCTVRNIPKIALLVFYMIVLIQQYNGPILGFKVIPCTMFKTRGNIITVDKCSSISLYIYISI